MKWINPSRELPKQGEMVMVCWSDIDADCYDMLRFEGEYFRRYAVDVELKNVIGWCRIEECVVEE